jgi:hypothetical protein
VPVSTKKTSGLGLYLPFQHHDSNPVVGARQILIEARTAQREPNCAADGEDNANPDQASAAIMPPEEETRDRDEKREEQKFNRQVKCRSKSNLDEPACVEVDERHRYTGSPLFFSSHADVLGTEEGAVLGDETRPLLGH